jgi:hypothetical protein
MNGECYDRLESARHKLGLLETSISGKIESLGNEKLQPWLENAASILRTSLNDINNVLAQHQKKAPDPLAKEDAGA